MNWQIGVSTTQRLSTDYPAFAQAKKRDAAWELRSLSNGSGLRRAGEPFEHCGQNEGAWQLGQSYTIVL